jgi:hypothetical protein
VIDMGENINAITKGDKSQQSYLIEGVSFADSLKIDSQQIAAEDEVEQTQPFTGKSQQRAAAEEVVQDERLSALKTVARLDPEYRFLSVGTSATKLPEQFTKLNLPSSSDTNSSITPEKQKQKFVATTVQDALIEKLGNAIDVKLTSASRSHANIALGVLTIIPYDQRKEPFSIQITRSSDDEVIVHPEDLFGRAEASFIEFQKLRSTYSITELDGDPIVKKLKEFAREKLSNREVNSKEHKALLTSTHHSEQFILASIYKTLDKILRVRDADFQAQIHNATFLLDIATELAPCDHCMSAIDDFMNYFREIIAGENIFVTRISWLKNYSNSFVSKSKTNQNTQKLDLADVNQNYFITCHITQTVLRQTGNIFTKLGQNASHSAACSSSKGDYGRQENAAAAVYVGQKKIMDSPPKGKNKLGSRDFTQGLKSMLQPTVHESRQVKTHNGQQIQNSFDQDQSFEGGQDFAEMISDLRQPSSDLGKLRSGSSINALFDEEAKKVDDRTAASLEVGSKSDKTADLKGAWKKPGELTAIIKSKQDPEPQEPKSIGSQLRSYGVSQQASKKHEEKTADLKGAWKKPGELASKIKLELKPEPRESKSIVSQTTSSGVSQQASKKHEEKTADLKGAWKKPRELAAKIKATKNCQQGKLSL